MRLNAPKKITWWIAVVLGVVSVIAKFVVIPFISVYAFWFAFVAFVLLALATYLKGF